MVLDTATLKNRKSTILLSTRGRDGAKELTLKRNITKVFTIAFLETKSIVNRNSKLAGPAKVHGDGRVGTTRSHVPSLKKREFKRYQGPWYLTLNKSGKNAPMRLRQDFRAAISLKKRLHRESGEEVAEPTSPQQYLRWHSSSSDSW